MDSHSQHLALELRGVRHTFGQLTAVKNLDLKVAPGEVVCLLGPSGCGKTTALRVAAGLEVPEAGEVFIRGRQVVGQGPAVPPEERNVGLVFQDYALFPHLTLQENVAFGMPGRKGNGRDRVEELLDLVGMGGRGEDYPHMLSGGQQQRVALARALARNPELVLMDEPFSGLDARLRDQVRDRTLHILKKAGAATLMVTHDAEEAMFMADRIAVMRDGRMVQMGTPDELYFKPVDAFVAEFFGEVNRLPAVVRDGQVETVVGQVDAGSVESGRAVEVVVRPEALRLHPAEKGTLGPGYAKVLASRLLGRSSLVHLCTCETAGREIHLHARVAGRFSPAEDDILRIELDSSQAFVFPVD